MKFCPKCEVRLKKNNSNSALSCPKCGYTESGSKETKKKKHDMYSSCENSSLLFIRSISDRLLCNINLSYDLYPQ